MGSRQRWKIIFRLCLTQFKSGDGHRTPAAQAHRFMSQFKMSSKTNLEPKRQFNQNSSRQKTNGTLKHGKMQIKGQIQG